MAKFQGRYKSDSHRITAMLERQSKYTFSPSGMTQSQGYNNAFGLNVQIDLRPLVFALTELGPEFNHSRVLRVGMYRTLLKLRSQYQSWLVLWTGINASAAGRLNQGVKIYTRHPPVQGIYRITDRHLSITKKYFNATYTKRFGVPGGLARWGKGNGGWPGVRHTAWARPQVAKGAFMLPGEEPAFTRMGKSRYPLKRLWGPNPAKELGIRHRVQAEQTLRNVAQQHFVPEVMKAYQYAEQKVKARHGL